MGCRRLLWLGLRCRLLRLVHWLLGLRRLRLALLPVRLLRRWRLVRLLGRQRRGK
jgi:hypothetical protein